MTGVLAEQEASGESPDNATVVDDKSSDQSEVVVPRVKIPFRSKVTLAILVFINLLNYMDRYSLAGVLTLIQKYFGNIGNKKAGLLQTVFVCCYMVFAPVFGYFGDRYSRKYVMAIGIVIWSVMTFAGSLVDDTQFWLFFVIRGLVGIGEASYSTVAPTIIADLFVGDQRTKAIAIFYFAIPCGSGLGYIVGSKVAAFANGEWQWAFRVTPGLGILCAILCIVAVHEPKRGAIESSPPEIVDELSASVYQESTSYWEDLKYLAKLKSFVLASVGFACVSFVVGSLAFWAPEFVLYSERVAGKTLTIDDVSYLFGIITFVTGIIGVALGAELARVYRKYNKKSDALVCGIGLLASTPFLFFALYVADKNVIIAWVLIAIGEIFLCLNWAPNGDLLLYVVVPTRRSTAEAAQILFIHVFGDATSPVIIGAISDYLRGSDKSDFANQKALYYALLITPFVAVFGAVAYHFCAQYLEHDKDAVEEVARRNQLDAAQRSLSCLPPSRHSSTSSEEDDASNIYVEDTDDNTKLLPDVAINGKHQGLRI